MKIIAIEVIHKTEDAPYFAELIGIGIGGGRYHIGILQYGEGIGFILRASQRQKEIISQVWPKFIESVRSE